MNINNNTENTVSTRNKYPMNTFYNQPIPAYVCRPELESPYYPNGTQDKIPYQEFLNDISVKRYKQDIYYKGKLVCNVVDEFFNSNSSKFELRRVKQRGGGCAFDTTLLSVFETISGWDKSLEELLQTAIDRK